MLLEKLLLNVFIVLSPILIYTAFSDRIKKVASPLSIGLVQGAASSLCLIFSYEALDLYWNLRYVPLVISTVYAGPVAGLINYLVILGFRAYLDGDAWYFGYASASLTLTFLGTLYLSRYFKNHSNRDRLRRVAAVAVLPSLLMLIIPLSYTLFNAVESPVHFTPIIALLLFGALETLGTWMLAMLLEFNNERLLLKEESMRAEKLKALGGVAASIAHEIRNPLTAVQGFLQLIRAGTYDRKTNDYLQIALDELERAESVIKDYLSFTKPKLTKFETFCLAELTHHIITRLTPLSSYKGIEFQCRFNGPMYIYTDREQLQQAIVNVIKNAVEASPENSSVQIDLALQGSQAELKIIDSGKGMTEEEIQRIGTLFYTTKEKGTGLGTSVAVRIIEAMKGNILYESEKGKGTVCIISLPLEGEQLASTN
ncbi:ATP-binding protein [Paenibacillus physcomitrellae]|uniref:histidine kinase n=1 Tax=Paenibacillus physcomitrellae TaxID=1619311 RepID=A0ABQ1FM77_9BACL|nr:ATP-binding protein [Paenibacillus physcomitrellae]GGA21192.1 sporulation kinase [Paenibacillus physcomitrellae]